MKLAASNIAWTPADARMVYGLMREYGFAGLEIAPALAFPDEADPFVPSALSISSFRDELAAFGLQLVSMQSLLFGVSGAQLFGNIAEQNHFEQAMRRAISLAKSLDIPNIVFGSPKNRAYPDEMSLEQALAHAKTVFQRLGDAAFTADTKISIEPNPSIYGTNFLTNVMDTALFVAEIDHPCITLNYDMGALYANAEADNVEAVYKLTSGRVSHVHMSEPNLAPVPADSKKNTRIIEKFIQLGYPDWFSIEMRAVAGSHLNQITASLAQTAKDFSEIRGRFHA